LGPLLDLQADGVRKQFKALDPSISFHTMNGVMSILEM
jgi:hypothetical protein